MKRIGILAAAAILVGSFAYAGYGVHQKRELRARVVEVVATVSRQFEEAHASAAMTPSAALAERLDAGVARAETAMQNLRALPARRDPELVDAADPYVASVVEVLRRQAAAVAYRARFNENREALDAHMANAGKRAENWGAEAIRLRQRLEQDYFDYQLSTASLGNLLAGLVEARRRIAAQLPAVPLPDEPAVMLARERSLAASGAVKKELEEARRLVGRG